MSPRHTAPRTSRAGHAVTRRSLLTMLAAAGMSFAARPARAGTSKVKNVERSTLGTTFTLELDHAPFPHGGEPDQDRTVLAFVPAAFKVERGGRVPLLVHFHGHRTTADKAIAAHELREQLVDSKQNAVLLVPQGPVNAVDSSAGSLEAPGGFARMIDEALRVLVSADARHALGRRAVRPGTVCLSAHSGGYHAAACCLKAGGVDVREVYLFDALYGDLGTFRDWVKDGRAAGTRHKLVSYYGAGATEANSDWLEEELTRAKVNTAYERHEGTLSREDIVRADALFIRTQVAHDGVTHELNALRDCLCASTLPRHLATAWFEAKTGARKLERRR